MEPVDRGRQVERKTVDRRGRHHDRVEAAGLEFLQPSLNVAAQLGEDKVGSMPCQLGPATNRAGGDVRTGRQRPPGCADERVACVGSGRDADEHETIGRGRREVLPGVHGEVGPAVEHSGLNLFDEHALATHRVDRHVGVAVADGRDDDLVDFTLELRRHVTRLPQRQRTPSRGCSQLHPHERRLSRGRTDRAASRRGDRPERDRRRP